MEKRFEQGAPCIAFTCELLAANIIVLCRMWSAAELLTFPDFVVAHHNGNRIGNILGVPGKLGSGAILSTFSRDSARIRQLGLATNLGPAVAINSGPPVAVR